MARLTYVLLRSLVIAALGILAVGAPATAAPGSAHHIVIVPGQSMGALPYQPMAAHFRDLGYQVRVLDLAGIDLSGDQAAVGRAVDEITRSDPDARVALVGHSVGGLSTRAYLRFDDGHEQVSEYIAIGTPQYGSPGACVVGYGEQACPGSEFLRALNAGDDTPGDTAYYGIRSEREWVDGHLDGGQCRVQIRGFEPLPDLGLEHTFEPADPLVWDAVAAALNGRCDGDVVDQADGQIIAEDTVLSEGWLG